MKNCTMQQNAFAACDERRGSPLICPKPRRVGQLGGPEPVRSIWWHNSYQTEICDTTSGHELLDIFLAKGGEIAGSPPFFAGSPPTRSANPIVHDTRFGEDKPLATPIQSVSPMSPRKSCARVKYGLKPAQVRVEGFDCLDRDRRTHGIYAMA